MGVALVIILLNNICLSKYLQKMRGLKMPTICVRDLRMAHKGKWLLNAIFIVCLGYRFMSYIVYMKRTLPQHTYYDVL